MVTYSDNMSGPLWGDGKDRDWLNPISMQKIKEATRRGKHRVELNGVEYKIAYKREGIYLSRVDGAYVPCGAMSYKAINSFRFEGCNG